VAIALWNDTVDSQKGDPAHGAEQTA
jgi:hypothetical protein